MSHRQRELEGLPETRRERIMSCVNAMVQTAVEEVQSAVEDARAREGEALRQSTVVLMQQLFRARGIDAQHRARLGAQRDILLAAREYPAAARDQFLVIIIPR